MGMFDDVIVNEPLPVPEGYVRVAPEGMFQTKSLECGLNTYKIEDGRLWVRDYYHPDGKWESCDYHGDVLFYDFYTVPGKCSKLVDFVARFSYGKCDYINYVGDH